MPHERIEEFCYGPKDFEFMWYSGTGAGGQHRNKHQNCLRLRFLHGNIEVTANGRSRQENRKAAFKLITPLIKDWIMKQINCGEFPRNYEVIRTYNIPDNRVKDAASGHEMAWDEMEKHFGDMIEARIKANVKRV